VVAPLFYLRICLNRPASLQGLLFNLRPSVKSAEKSYQHASIKQFALNWGIFTVVLQQISLSKPLARPVIAKKQWFELAWFML
jgi:hypothetical protein